VHLRTGPARRFKTKTNLDAFDGMDAHQRLRQAPIQLAIPVHVRAQADRQAFDDDFKNAADRITGFARLVDASFDSFRRFVAQAAHFGCIGDFVDLARRWASTRIDLEAADFNNVAADVNVACFEQAARDRTGSDAHGGFACAGAFEHVAHVVQRAIFRPPA
jgi:hypothetical protein